MTQRKTIQDLNPSDVVPNCLRVISLGGTQVRTAFMFSDENWEVGAGAIFDFDMDVPGRVTPVYGYTDFFMDYICFENAQYFLETGNRIHEQRNSSWAIHEQSASFIRAFGSTANGDLYCLGDDGQIFLRKGSNWVNDESNSTALLHAIHGNAAGKTCAVGAQGTLLERQANGWISVETGIGVEFRSVHVFPDGDVGIGGADGTLFRIHNEEILDFDTGNCGDIQFLSSFQKDFFVTDSEIGISKTEGMNLVPVMNCGYAGRMNIENETLCVAAAEMVFTLSDNQWRCCRIVFDGGIRNELIDIENHLI